MYAGNISTNVAQLMRKSLTRVAGRMALALLIFGGVGLLESCRSSSSNTLVPDPQSDAASAPELARNDRPYAVPSRSSPVAITSDGRWVVVANRHSDSLGIIEVLHEDGSDNGYLLKEIPVGRDPRFVAVAPDNTRAYVSNAADGTVSVVALRDSNQTPVQFRTINTIPVGTEPRGLALTPNGTHLYVANFSAGTVSVIDTATRAVIATVNVGGNPYALTISNDLDADDQDESVYVSLFYAEPIAGASVDGGRQANIATFTVAEPNTIQRIALAPTKDSGFTATRADFCADTGRAGANLHSTTFCPLSASAPDYRSAQGAFPNQLHALLLRGDSLYAPSIAASPEPPLRFDVTVQPLVSVIDVPSKTESENRRVNLNALLDIEPPVANTVGKLTRLFVADPVAMDANRSGDEFLLVSRGSNYVLRAQLDATGRLSLGDRIVRLRTGNIPTGVVISPNAQRAYVYNEVNMSVTALNLETDEVMTQDISAAEGPSVPSRANEVLIGQLVFYSSLGVPGGRVRDRPVRAFVPIYDRGKTSKDGWMSCASCHPDGLTDNVTWQFPDGPRQTPSLAAFFAPDDTGDQRLAGWSATRGGVYDYNNLIRDHLGGTGLSDGPATDLYDHGFERNRSDALDLVGEWLQTVRAPVSPPPLDASAVVRGRAVFAANCASCHGGAKWTKSRIIYNNDPTFSAPPGTEGATVRDPNLSVDGAQIVSYKDWATGTLLRFLDDVGTFDPTNTAELRGGGPSIGQIALGARGFNSPSLLSLGLTAPYFHDGSAATLDDVYRRHLLASGASIAATLALTELTDLNAFVLSIDDTTATMDSATETLLRTAGRGP